MATYRDHESVDIMEASEIGENFRRVQRVTREDDEGNVVEFVSLKEGFIRNDPEDGPVEQYTDSTSLGSVKYIGDVAEALKELEEKIHENEP